MYTTYKEIKYFGNHSFFTSWKDIYLKKLNAKKQPLDDESIKRSRHIKAFSLMDVKEIAGNLNHIPLEEILLI